MIALSIYRKQWQAMNVPIINSEYFILRRHSF